ncbi:MAG TPA: aminopeptidase P family protein [Spirochaetia bacterium]|nr:aminopeptidase P family protein [Spirochaetia bacterium]
MLSRVERVRAQLPERGLCGLIVLRRANVQYLSGFSGSNAALYIDAQGAFLLSDFRYAEQAAAESPAFTFVLVKGSLLDAVADLARERRCGDAGVEDDYLSYRDFCHLGGKMACALKPAAGLVEKMRLVKDEGEIEALARACRLADEALAEILPHVRPGVTENEVAARLEFVMRLKGSEGASFETIAASGPRSAMPHATASERLLQTGDLVTLDFGAVWRGYHSDMTRTFVLGAPSPEQERIYRLVLEAQALGVEAVRPGIATKAVDALVRDKITAAGHGEHFGHATGHGVGLAVHENPRLADKDETVLAPGMVVTVEPGVYIPGFGGVRIEDSVLVTDKGHRVLTGAPKVFVLQ